MFESLKSSIDRMEGIINSLGMGSFQKTVVVIFLLLLVGILIFLGIMINNNKSSKKWPPVVSNCPDYWLDKPKDGEDVSAYVSGSNCTGIYDKNIGNFKIESTETVSKNFTETAYMGSLGNCEKYKWANANGISWDGVNYGVNVDPTCK